MSKVLLYKIMWKYIVDYIHNGINALWTMYKEALYKKFYLWSEFPKLYPKAILVVDLKSNFD